MKELNGYSSAFPVSGDLIDLENKGHFNGYNTDYKGLTVRQEFAKAALQGLATTLSNEVTSEVAKKVAKESVLLADALIDALNENEY